MISIARIGTTHLRGGVKKLREGGMMDEGIGDGETIAGTQAQ